MLHFLANVRAERNQHLPLGADSIEHAVKPDLLHLGLDLPAKRSVQPLVRGHRRRYHGFGRPLALVCERLPILDRKQRLQPLTGQSLPCVRPVSHRVPLVPVSEVRRKANVLFLDAKRINLRSFLEVVLYFEVVQASHVLTPFPYASRDGVSILVFGN